MERREQEDLAELKAEAVFASLLPKSKATNAYELLEELIQAVLEEPLRYDQSDWLSQGVYRMSIHRTRGRNVPACGTVACFAGWVVTLVQGYDAYAKIGYNSIAGQAAHILGFDWEDCYRSQRYGESNENYAAWEEHFDHNIRPIRKLFDNDLDNYVEGEYVMPEAGSLAYAQLGIKKLREFMATHEARLKAKAL